MQWTFNGHFHLVFSINSFYINQNNSLVDQRKEKIADKKIPSRSNSAPGKIELLNIKRICSQTWAMLTTTLIRNKMPIS